MDHRTQRFVAIYNEIDRHSLGKLASIYTEDISFVDPFHKIQGLDALTSYFQGLYENVSDIEFLVTNSYEVDDISFIYWTMTYQHRKLNGGKDIKVDGHSRLNFIGDKVSQHRDYFDSAQMLYRQIPLLGGVIRLLDKRITA
ncbi:MULTISPECIES: nuclear transport factor 2 family protein [Pseudoalteromonas]|uniref:nuclear transport factor 2 family protein n=1 Tax=Pseudoalteromonas TaxID=53246 RepID=UPI001107F7AA|nr:MULTISPECIES: nuclear transport factor 2 family protein [Pseudoalteromonas]MCG9761009.1 nuclear transport factor 2 family protein [Pseudoalteromonas sp. Isolate6]NKC20823.1 nuclear transport factor 2 family protein [Pseudoalteromonas galatheae]